MTDVSGTYEIVAKTPMGKREMKLVIQADGGAFTGSTVGPLGSEDIAGTVEGSTLRWEQQVTKPFPMTLNCEIRIDGDAVDGSISTGLFGSFPVSGTRAG